MPASGESLRKQEGHPGLHLSEHEPHLAPVVHYDCIFGGSTTSLTLPHERFPICMTADAVENAHATTVLGVRHNGQIALGSDGQATMGETVMKTKAEKVRSLYNDEILAGFAGSTADAFTLFERFEGKLQEYGGNVTRAAVELAKDWRTDKYLRRLEALLAVASGKRLLLISGAGDVIEPDDNILAIGSGGSFALAATRALLPHADDLTAREVVEQGLSIAADICIYTNHNQTIMDIDAED